MTGPEIPSGNGESVNDALPQEQWERVRKILLELRRRSREERLTSEELEDAYQAEVDKLPDELKNDARFMRGLRNGYEANIQSYTIDVEEDEEEGEDEHGEHEDTSTARRYDPEAIRRVQRSWYRDLDKIKTYLSPEEANGLRIMIRGIRTDNANDTDEDLAALSKRYEELRILAESKGAPRVANAEAEIEIPPQQTGSVDATTIERMSSGEDLIELRRLVEEARKKSIDISDIIPASSLVGEGEVAQKDRIRKRGKSKPPPRRVGGEGPAWRRVEGGSGKAEIEERNEAGEVVRREASYHVGAAPTSHTPLHRATPEPWKPTSRQGSRPSVEEPILHTSGMPIIPLKKESSEEETPRVMRRELFEKNHQLSDSVSTTDKKEDIPLNKLAYGFVPGVDLFKRWMGLKRQEKAEKAQKGPQYGFVPGRDLFREWKQSEEKGIRARKEGIEEQRAAVKTRLEARQAGTVLSEAEKLGHAQTLQKFAEGWKKHKWKRIALSAGLTALGLAGTTGAVAMGPFMLGSIVLTQGFIRGVGAGVTAATVYKTMHKYFEKRNYPFWQRNIYAGLCATLVGGAVVGGSYLLQHIGVDDVIREKLGFGAIDVAPVPPSEIAAVTDAPAILADTPPVGVEETVPAFVPDVSPQGAEEIVPLSPPEAGGGADAGIMSNVEDVPREVLYDADSPIASKGIDGLIDEHMVSENGVLESYNLSSEAQEQFKDAVRRVLVANPTLAQDLLQTNVDVVGKGDIVFPDSGTLDMTVFGNERFLEELEETILQRERRYLLPALGGESGIHELISNLKQAYGK